MVPGDADPRPIHGELRMRQSIVALLQGVGAPRDQRFEFLAETLLALQQLRLGLPLLGDIQGNTVPYHTAVGSSARTRVDQQPALPPEREMKWHQRRKIAEFSRALRFGLRIVRKRCGRDPREERICVQDQLFGTAS